MEAALLGCFMVSAALFATLVGHPSSPVSSVVADPFVRRISMGLAMASTLVCLVFSPWGKQSGAHMNPSVTLTYWRLGKVGGADACFYVAAHFLGQRKLKIDLAVVGLAVSVAAAGRGGIGCINNWHVILLIAVQFHFAGWRAAIQAPSWNRRSITSHASS